MDYHTDQMSAKAELVDGLQVLPCGKTVAQKNNSDVLSRTVGTTMEFW